VTDVSEYQLSVLTNELSVARLEARFDTNGKSPREQAVKVRIAEVE